MLVLILIIYIQRKSVLAVISYVPDDNMYGTLLFDFQNLVSIADFFVYQS